jgi:drug/metabolite transporter (DMT)-like permease
MRRRIVPGYGFGILLGVAAATCWSLGGVLVRLTDGIDSWQIVLYRSFTVLILMGTWMALTHGRRALAVIRHAGLNGLVAGIAVGLAGLCFVLSLFYTTVAQSIFMTGISPFCAAFLAWWLLGERVGWASFGAMTIALIGLGIMVAGSLGHTSFIGTLLALYSAFCFSCYSVLLRNGQQTDMTVALIWNAIFLCLLSLVVLLVPTPLRDGFGPGELAIGWTNTMWVTLMGAVQLTLGLVLFTLASRSVPAAQLALLALVEPTLGPVWAFLAVNEVPPVSTLIGGVVVMSAIVIQVLATSGGRVLALPDRRIA